MDAQARRQLKRRRAEHSEVLQYEIRRVKYVCSFSLLRTSAVILQQCSAFNCCCCSCIVLSRVQVTSVPKVFLFPCSSDAHVLNRSPPYHCQDKMASSGQSQLFLQRRSTSKGERKERDKRSQDRQNEQLSRNPSRNTHKASGPESAIQLLMTNCCNPQLWE